MIINILQNFIGLLKGFTKLLELPTIMKEASDESALLKRLSQLEVDGGIFPDMSAQVKFFKVVILNFFFVYANCNVLI